MGVWYVALGRHETPWGPEREISKEGLAAVIDGRRASVVRSISVGAGLRFAVSRCGRLLCSSAEVPSKGMGAKSASRMANVLMLGLTKSQSRTLYLDVVWVNSEFWALEDRSKS